VVCVCVCVRPECAVVCVWASESGGECFDFNLLVDIHSFLKGRVLERVFTGNCVVVFLICSAEEKREYTAVCVRFSDFLGLKLRHTLAFYKHSIWG
jgi:hypothetical protein